MRILNSNGLNKPFSISMIILALALVAGYALVSARSKFAAADEEAAIRAVITQHAAAHETGDLAAIEKLWVQDDTATVAEGGSFNYGWTDFRDHHLRPELEAMENIKFPIEDIKIHVKGDLAWVTYSYRMSGKYKGSLLLTAGAATVVLEKRGGAWLIVHEHTSTKRRPPAAPAAKPEQNNEQGR